MKILFHTNQLNLRGTTTAILDYAKYNQEILGNESIICYDESNPMNEPGVYDIVKKSFNVISSPLNTNSVERIIDREKIDFAYFLRGGAYDFIPTNCKTGVHAVFQINNPHGDIYAYVSEWLSGRMSNNIPWVPHIVDLPPPTKNY